MSCTFDEFQKFEAFFSEFMTLSREFFLPPERQSFGLVTERFLLTSLEARDHDSWVMVIHVAGCPNCSKVLKDGNDFRSALHMHHSPVTELEREGNDADFTLPANKPSMILFVDRSSESLITKRKSQAALQVFRKFALDNHVSIQTDLKETVTLSKFSAQAFPGKEGGSASDQSKHPRRHSTLTRVGSLKNKSCCSQETNSKSNKPLLEVPTGNIAENDVNPDKANVHNDEILTLLEPEDLTGVEPSKIKERTVTYIVKHTEIIPSSPDQMTADRSLPQDLLNSLTARSEIPSVVIVDPFSEQHFIYPQQKNFSYSSLQGFLDGFLNGSLVPFQRSESVSRSPREATQPPFVNLDFREFDSIPRVTAHTFSELVLGFNQSHTRNFGHSWENDVLVLFSNSWCGFCQRMELVVREVFRAFKGYVNVLKSGNTEHIHEDAKLPEFPLIFLMDCTSNDCTSLLKSMGQREVYPALLLFPAQRKTAVSYRGDMSVNNVMKFLIDHGSNSHHLNQVEGILWTVRGKGSRDEVRIKDSSPALIRIKEDSAAKREYLEVLLNKTPTRSTETHPTESHSSNDLHEATPDVLVGSMLVSTDKLLNAPPFDKSVILIVQANQSIGFQGLIINKHMSWESFEKLDKHLELVRQAPLSFGGPVIAQGMPLVCMTRRITQESYPEVLPSVYFLDHLATVRELEGFKLGNKSSDDYWFFLGYSSWGWDQLFAEIAEGAWQISDDPVGDFNWPGS
ncbi:hypothetical protein IFM89_025014 [Coptis chinensis]|uniref:Thioredoxin domain-containing protein n=1 Tax=Coptis chinensis TaxID=261450 RepID=A0A835HVA2_9MAGN|nr:hypothetical protein IFM89_025014 [Coptis chinensis]